MFVLVPLLSINSDVIYHNRSNTDTNTDTNTNANEIRMIILVVTYETSRFTCGTLGWRLELSAHPPLLPVHGGLPNWEEVQANTTSIEIQKKYNRNTKGIQKIKRNTKEIQKKYKRNTKEIVGGSWRKSESLRGFYANTSNEGPGSRK